MNNAKHKFQIFKGLGGTGRSSSHFIGLRSERGNRGKIIFIDSPVDAARIDSAESKDATILFTKEKEDK